MAASKGEVPAGGIGWGDPSDGAADTKATNTSSWDPNTIFRAQESGSNDSGDYSGHDSDGGQSGDGDLDEQLEQAAEELHLEGDAAHLEQDIPSVASVAGGYAASEEDSRTALEVVEAEMAALQAEFEARLAQARLEALVAESKMKLAQKQAALVKLRSSGRVNHPTPREESSRAIPTPPQPKQDSTPMPTLLPRPPTPTASPTSHIASPPSPPPPPPPPPVPSPAKHVPVVLPSELSDTEELVSASSRDRALAWSRKYSPPRLNADQVRNICQKMVDIVRRDHWAPAPSPPAPE